MINELPVEILNIVFSFGRKLSAPDCTVQSAHIRNSIFSLSLLVPKKSPSYIDLIVSESFELNVLIKCIEYLFDDSITYLSLPSSSWLSYSRCPVIWPSPSGHANGDATTRNANARYGSSRNARNGPTPARWNDDGWPP